MTIVRVPPVSTGDLPTLCSATKSCHRDRIPGSPFCLEHSQKKQRVTSALGVLKLGTSVYAARSEQGFKFGHARDVKRRVNEIRTSSPVEIEIYGSLLAGTWLERAIHTHLWEHRIRGEWFRHAAPVQQVADWIRDGEYWQLQKLARD